jgi:hypothetical protein
MVSAAGVTCKTAGKPHMTMAHDARFIEQLSVDLAFFFASSFMMHRHCKIKPAFDATRVARIHSLKGARHRVNLAHVVFSGVDALNSIPY